MPTRSPLRPCARHGFDPLSPADHAEVLRLLAKRNHDIGVRIRTICRLHSLLAELAP
jgi:hypothetical protein